MDKKWILIGLDGSPGLGWKRISNIVKFDDEWENALDFTPADWIQRGLSTELANEMSSRFTASWVEERVEKMDKKGIQFISYWDEEYPILMKETNNPPWVLYAKGDSRLLSTLSVAMVGTRLPTAYGRKVGEMLTEGLCAHGVTIVSGLAKGIDGVCHEAALNCAGSTIAVLGTAIDIAYPPEHSSLYRRIAERGLIISEYPIGTAGHPGLFPQRNRIIAGVTRGTVIVEADARSGSLITADRALDANRDIFAVPGPITSPKSRGCLELLKQGAKIVTDPSDILEEYGLWSQGKKVDMNKGLTDYELTDEEQRIYHMLEQGTRSFDELMNLSEWDFGLLHSVLLSLIMKKAVVQLPGSVYKLI
ncbi:DNA-processing protein DprA [Paenibacillus segetis]|uniref:DNA processing protein DprA n=1 Tax=Paenibacillus segetis TaxID=1325360 RepID=A0ABQ1Y9L8_9BACL|nr:DNA-processing protein DprA [Paenibacillus segetis]GGH17521.1 DNA processing protein DprA [Paenibacillus segetis]